MRVYSVYLQRVRRWGKEQRGEHKDQYADYLPLLPEWVQGV